MTLPRPAAKVDRSAWFTPEAIAHHYPPFHRPHPRIMAMLEALPVIADQLDAANIELAALAHDIERYIQHNTDLLAENERLAALLNTPEIVDFSEAVKREAAHQRERWGTDHDIGKAPEDWFWLVGYLAGKALSSQKAGNQEKALHHCISTSAALANWHAAILG